MDKRIIIGGVIVVVLLIIFGFRYSKGSTEDKHKAFLGLCLNPAHGNTQASCEQAWGIAQSIGIDNFQDWSDNYNQGSRKVG